MPATVKRVALGLDIGGTRIKAVAIEAPGTILAEFELASRASEGPSGVRAALKEAVALFNQQNIAFSSVGVGCAGSVDGNRGIVRNSPNFADWKNVPLKTILEADLGVPVVVDNDANVAVYGEWKAGKAAGCRNVVLLTLGTGIGGGLILNGDLFRGSTGTGGELGHISIHANGKQCNCGNVGCFEKYCSGTAIRERAGDVSSKEVFSPENRFRYKQVISDFLADFRIGLVSIANAFDPDLILLGGAVSYGVEQYIEELRSWIRLNAFPAVGAHVRLELAQHGNLSGAMGAALLSLSE